MNALYLSDISWSIWNRNACDVEPSHAVLTAVISCQGYYNKKNIQLYVDMFLATMVHIYLYNIKKNVSPILWIQNPTLKIFRNSVSISII